MGHYDLKDQHGNVMGMISVTEDGVQVFASGVREEVTRLNDDSALAMAQDIVNTVSFRRNCGKSQEPILLQVFLVLMPNGDRAYTSALPPNRGLRDRWKEQGGRLLWVTARVPIDPGGRGYTAMVSEL